jgi:hypothetical protein
MPVSIGGTDDGEILSECQPFGDATFGAWSRIWPSSLAGLPSAYGLYEVYNNLRTRQTERLCQVLKVLTFLVYYGHPGHEGLFEQCLTTSLKRIGSPQPVQIAAMLLQVQWNRCDCSSRSVDDHSWSISGGGSLSR